MLTTHADFFYFALECDEMFSIYGTSGVGTQEILRRQRVPRLISQLPTPRSLSPFSVRYEMSISHIPEMPQEFNAISSVLQLKEHLMGDYSIQAVDARALHSVLGVKKKFTDWFSEQVERLQLIESQDFKFIQSDGKNPLGGRPSQNFVLSIDAAKSIAISSHCLTGKLVRKYFLFMERKAQELTQAKALPSNYREALVALVASLDEVEALAQEADYLRRTKAQISDSKTASVLGKHGAVVKKVKKLEKEIAVLKDESTDFATILAIQSKTKEKYDWRLLKRFSNSEGLEIKKIAHERFGEIKSYHFKAWQLAYNISIKELFLQDA